MALYFNSLRDGGQVPLDENRAYISVIPKPNKDSTDIPNYRPISLINCDLKILTKLLALRLSAFLPQYTHKDQSGFINQRQTLDQIRRSITLISAVHSKWDAPCSRELLLLSLDLHKAFDSLNWDYLFTTLEAFGFGSTFISLLKTLYSNPSAQVSIRGYRSLSFPIRRGTRQGCPLSPLLFALAIEPLAITIRSHPKIHGVCCGQQVHKCVLCLSLILKSLYLLC